MIAPAMEFLALVNERFPEREHLRDRSHLGRSYEEIALALVRLFLIRDDLRPDLRELAMRLATFQDLPEDVRHLAIPLRFPPENDGQRQISALVVAARTALWEKLDQIEADYPSGSSLGERREPGLLITVEDRGWRPESPLDVLDAGQS